MLYLASENELPKAKTEIENSDIYIEKHKTLFNAMNISFNKRNIYYVGSDEGCSCGFMLEVDCKHQENSILQQKKRNQYRLFEYLNDCLETETSLELYGVYNGDEGQKVVSERNIKIKDLIDKDFFFVEKELLIVHK
jgi:hypothetical protein